VANLLILSLLLSVKQSVTQGLSDVKDVDEIPMTSPSTGGRLHVAYDKLETFSVQHLTYSSQKYDTKFYSLITEDNKLQSIIICLYVHFFPFIKVQ